jgi:hypothetical protein
VSTGAYQPGAHLAVVDPAGVVLISAETPDEAVATVRQGLASASTGAERLAAVLDALTGGLHAGLSAVPSFAAAMLGDVAGGRATVSVIVRGRYRAEIVGDQAATLDGLAVTTWREQSVTGAVGVELSALDVEPGGRRFALDSGVALAGAVRLSVAEAAPFATGEAEAPAPAVDLPQPAEPDPAPHLVAPPQSPAPPQPPVLQTPTVAPPPAPAPRSVADQTLSVDVTIADEPDERDEPEDRAAVRPLTSALVTGVPPAGTPDADGLEDYSYLWGQTIVQAVETAAVREQPEARAEAAASQGDHDGETVHLEELLAARRAETAAGSPPAGPDAATPWSAPPVSAGASALSRTCGSGHANPPHAATCTRCGDALTAPPRLAPRPALGRLRLSSGGTVDLDRSVILGRNPQANRVTAAGLPRLVAVGGKEVSRSHVEVRLEDWNVLAVDLGSRNGTLLRRPGQPPVRITPNDPVPLRTGDALDLGEGIVVTAEEVP